MRQNSADNQISNVFIVEHGFSILLATIWASEHLIESVMIQKITTPSYKIEI
jgi:hypothetical protein